MEPVTHFLTGACLGRAGLNRKTAYATLAATLAAEAADLDVLWRFAGPVEELKRHRGITHTFVAVPLVAAAVVGVVWLFHRWSDGRRQRRLAVFHAEPGAPLPRSLEPVRVRWVWLYAVALLAALSHILLDWTNNYGVRPFFPFNPRWYAGSFVFIADPVLWALLLAAVLMPALFGLADREIGARRPAFRGRGWAIFALCGVLVYWCVRWAEHAQAMAMLENTQVTSEPALRVFANPYPLTPFRWHGIVETHSLFQTAEVDSHAGTIDSDPQNDVIFKPSETAAMQAAKRTPLGQVYMDWGTWALVRDVGQEPVPAMEPPRLFPGRTWTTVEFTDLRFGYDFSGRGNAAAPSSLTGWVYIVDGREDAGEAIGRHVQK